MSNRRQFLGTLGKALGAGGLLLPWAGKGALALPADLGKAAQLPVTATALPFSPEALQLRQIRRELRACYLGQHDYSDNDTYSRAWRDLMRNQYHPLVEQVVRRPAATWTHCVELAEVCWQSMAHKHGIAADQGIKIRDEHDPTIPLIEAVLSLGGGERFSPTDPAGWEGRRHD